MKTALSLSLLMPVTVPTTASEVPVQHVNPVIDAANPTLNRTLTNVDSTKNTATISFTQDGKTLTLKAVRPTLNEIPAKIIAMLNVSGGTGLWVAQDNEQFRLVSVEQGGKGKVDYISNPMTMAALVKMLQNAGLTLDVPKTTLALHGISTTPTAAAR
jgi:glucosamine 6-phosphate synthetase-like amidotransferase/phosphosugar isomerase protein